MTMVKVNKTVARNAYNEGRFVEVLPCKCQYNSPWVYPVMISKINCDDRDFDKLVNEFEYYYANELGRYCSYYIAES